MLILKEGKLSSDKRLNNVFFLPFPPIRLCARLNHSVNVLLAMLMAKNARIWVTNFYH